MNTRGRLMMVAAVVIVLAVVVGAATFRLWRPLFVNDVVDEAFPEAAENTQPEAAEPTVEEVAPTEAAVGEPTPAEAEQVEPTEQTEPTESAEETEPQTGEAMEGMEGATVLASGSFIDIDDFHGGSGTATVYELADGSQILRFENFEVTNGPDLYVYLSGSPDPRASNEVMDTGYVDLGSLKGNVGDQNYDIPPGTDLSQYQSVVIYCVPFHVVFSTATLAGA